MTNADFNGRATLLLQVYSTIAVQSSENIVDTRGVELLVEGLFLNIVVSLESFFESLCIQGLLVGEYDGCNSIFSCSSEDHYRQMILADAKYTEWLPIEKTIKRLKIYFEDFSSFTLTETEIGVISEICYIRNAVAHSSDFARLKFEKSVLDNKRMAHFSNSPGRFLMADFQSGRSYFEYYVDEIRRIVNKL